MTDRPQRPPAPTTGGRLRVRVAPIAAAGWSALAVGLSVALAPDRLALAVSLAWAVALITWAVARRR